MGRAALLTLCAAAGVVGAAMLCPSSGDVAKAAADEPAHPAALDDAIIAAAKRHGVPEHLVRRIIMRESKYNPQARNHRYWGLMQISYPTARSMGFKGTPQELLNPIVNLRYAVPYLANAFNIAGRREDAAVRLYAAGYYFTARTKGLLSVLRTADSVPLSGVPEETPQLASNAVVQPPESQGIFGALFGPGSSLQPQPAPTQVAAAYSADASQAAPAPAAPQLPAAPQAAAAPAHTFDGTTTEMVAGKSGDLAPPKRWQHDGGTTVIARGEQSADQLAAREGPADETGRKASRHHAHKVLAFAQLDVPPSSAQAYAPGAAQDPRFAGSAPQAAISQMAAGAVVPPGQPEAVPAGQPVAAANAGDPAQADFMRAGGTRVATAGGDAEDAKPAKHRVRHARHKGSESRTREARADKSDEASKPAVEQAAAPADQAPSLRSVTQ